MKQSPPQTCLGIRTSNLANTKNAWMGNTNSVSGSLGMMMTEANATFILWFPHLSILAIGNRPYIESIASMCIPHSGVGSYL